MKDDTENKLNEGFISRWSKRKSSEKSDQDKNKSLEAVSYTHLRAHET